jgi:hypothetical protein
MLWFMLQAGGEATDIVLPWIERLGIVGGVLLILGAIMTGRLFTSRYVEKQEQNHVAAVTRLEKELSDERLDHEATRQELRTYREQERQRTLEWQRLAEDGRAELERVNILVGVQAQLLGVQTQSQRRS